MRVTDFKEELLENNREDLLGAQPRQGGPLRQLAGRTRATGASAARASGARPSPSGPPRTSRSSSWSAPSLSWRSSPARRWAAALSYHAKRPCPARAHLGIQGPQGACSSWLQASELEELAHFGKSWTASARFNFHNGMWLLLCPAHARLKSSSSGASLLRMEGTHTGDEVGQLNGLKIGLMMFWHVRMPTAHP